MKRIFICGWLILVCGCKNFEENKRLNEVKYMFECGAGVKGPFTKKYAGIRGEWSFYDANGKLVVISTSRCNIWEIDARI